MAHPITTEQTRHRVERAVRSTNWLEILGRAGYTARGAVYAIIGILALLAAFGMGGQTTGTRGALATLLDEPFGQVIIGLIAIGLLGYSVWRFFQGALNADNHDHDAKGYAIRAGLFISAITYLFLALYAGSLLFGGGSGASAAAASSSGGENTDRLASWVLSQPFGAWLLGFIGVAIIGAGVAQFVKGVRSGYRKWLSIDFDRHGWADPLCRIGLIARGIVFGILGVLVIIAAYQNDPSEAEGLGGMLRTLRAQPAGPWLLGVMAIGLICFAIYSFVEARYRKIEYRPRSARQAIRQATPMGGNGR